MGMFPRRTATVFYAVTCGILIVETIVNIPNLIILIQSMTNLALAMESNPVSTPLIMNDYSGALWIVVIIASIVVLVKYRMKAIKVFLGIVLNVIFLIVYTGLPLAIFAFTVIGLSDTPTR